MNSRVAISVQLLRRQRYLWFGCLLTILILGHSQSAQAQSAAISSGNLRSISPQDDRMPIFEPYESEHGETPDTNESQEESMLQSAGRPPLPFRAPAIGPLIRHVSMDDIARRTTAFFPHSLDELTAIDMPDEDKWIRVDLSEQIVVAYENDNPIRAFVVSTGLPGTPTVTGTFRIRMKVEEQSMVGGEGSMYYNLPGVKWVQYFHEDYGFHGTYWHSNFGQPMSHGCVNMTDTDAKWLFDWAGPTWDGETTWYPSTTDNPGTMVIVTP
ncbi:MAG: L,D-transpeptidase [Anaerolineales bacterium]|nr:L,D-transpeptidase [Anaerolineales bacterium]